MKNFQCLYTSKKLVRFIFCLCIYQVSNNIDGVSGVVPEYVLNFGNFSDHLVHILETSEPTEHRPGVHLYTPFGIGYILANIYEKLWPVPVREIPESIFTLRKYVATDYAALLRLFKKRQFRISSTIYSRFGNVTKPPTFKQLLTQVISLDMHANRTEFRESIREILERGTKGHLEDQMLPKKEPAWREIFDNTTHGVYVNTLYYKSDWDKPWTNIGEKKFFDNSVVPFIELQGEYPFAETDNATAVIINFQASTKQVILFKPRDFTSVTDMRRIVRNMLMNETLWKVQNVTIQMPSLNVTNLSQPSDKFSFLGVMDTFCRGRYMDSSQFYYNQHPLAHANHFEFSENFLELASASGSLVAFQNNRDFLPKPPANQTQHETGTTSDVDYFDILEASEEEDEMFQDYIVDARSDLPFKTRRFRGEFRANFKKQNNASSIEFQECDPISALSPDDYERKEMFEDDSNVPTTMLPSTSTSPTNNTSSSTPILQSSQSVGNDTNANNNVDNETKPQELPQSSPKPPSSGFDTSNKMLVLDTPFSWILRDKEIGEVFYGSISSIVYITVGALIIAHIVQTEKVEWFPNAYYRIPEANGPVASKIVVPRPQFENRFQDYEVYRPKQNPVYPFRPHYQPGIFPVKDDSFIQLGEQQQQQKAIYYRRNIGLFICLATTLIVINVIQLITDTCLFYSTLKGKGTTSFWVYFLLNIILWIMSLICFITIFSGGGIFLLLVFLSGTAIRVYTVFALHELMSDIRKPRASSVTSEGIEQEIKTKTRTYEEMGNNETLESDEPTNATDAGDEAAAEENASSTKSLQPAQDEDEAEVVKMENDELQSSDMGKTDEEEDNENNVEELLEPVDLLEDPDCVDKLEDIVEEPEEDVSNETCCEPENDEEPKAEEGEQEENNEEKNENEDCGEESIEIKEEDEGELAQEYDQDKNEAGESSKAETGEVTENNEHCIESINTTHTEETEMVPDEKNTNFEENENIEPDIGESEDAITQENEQGDEITKECESEENEPQETDSPVESGENEEPAEPAMDEGEANSAEMKEENDSQKKRKKSKRKRKIKQA